MKILREKLISGQLEINELELLLDQPNWAEKIKLQGDEWRDYVDNFDWENLGPNNLVNKIFSTIDLTNGGIEEIGYFGIHTIQGMIENPNFAKENLLIINNVLIEAASDLDTFREIFLDFYSDNDTYSEWLNLYELVESELENLDLKASLIEAKLSLKNFFKGNIE